MYFNNCLTICFIFLYICIVFIILNMIILLFVNDTPVIACDNNIIFTARYSDYDLHVNIIIL